MREREREGEKEGERGRERGRESQARGGRVTFRVQAKVVHEPDHYI